MKRDADGTRVLSEVDLKEVSLVLHPANPAAKIESAKSADALAAIRGKSDEELLAELRPLLGKSRPEITVSTFEC